MNIPDTNTYCIANIVQLTLDHRSAEFQPTIQNDICAPILHPKFIVFKRFCLIGRPLTKHSLQTMWIVMLSEYNFICGKGTHKYRL